MTAKPPNLESLRQELLRVASIADPTERLLEVAAVIGEALSDLDVQPVVVGGLALAYWSDSDEFITGDIDVVVPRVPELPERLKALGFRAARKRVDAAGLRRRVRGTRRGTGARR